MSDGAKDIQAAMAEAVAAIEEYTGALSAQQEAERLLKLFDQTVYMLGPCAMCGGKIQLMEWMGTRYSECRGCGVRLLAPCPSCGGKLLPGPRVHTADGTFTQRNFTCERCEKRLNLSFPSNMFPAAAAGASAAASWDTQWDLCPHCHSRLIEHWRGRPCAGPPPPPPAPEPGGPVALARFTSLEAGDGRDDED